MSTSRIRPKDSERTHTGTLSSRQRASLWLCCVLLASGCTLPGIGTPMPTLSVPTCPANAGCGEGFLYQGRIYGPVCVSKVRREAISSVALATGDAAYPEVRSIIGLPPDLFLAVRSPAPCNPSSEDEWFLAQAEVTSAQLEQVHDQLLRVTMH